MRPLHFFATAAFTLVLGTALAAGPAPGAQQPSASASRTKSASSDHWQLPVTVHTLSNGLTLVVSEDQSSPTVGISVVYKVGMRREPRGRSGFAHLFEHLMFQGTPLAPKGVFDRVTTAGGGDNNGSTRADFTNYIERAPVSALETMLWLEADRMKTLDFNPTTLKNQQDVVKEEIRVNVQNAPYGGFMWIDIGMLAFDKWENKHDGYGSFEDLDNANLDDVRAFHRDFYGPNNAVIAIAGAVTPARALALVKKHFDGIPRRPVPPLADFSEPLNTAERRLVQSDALAQVPGLAAAWKMPVRGSADHAPMVVLGEVLAGGNASRLYQGLVKGRELALNLESLWGLTGPWQYDGPTLFTLFALYKPGSNPNSGADGVLAAVDEEVARIVREGVSEAELRRVKTRMKADWYNGLESFLGRADLLAQLQALWGDARVVSQVPVWIDGVTSAQIQRVAATYLTRANRSVIDRRPAPPAAPTASTPNAR
jgi:predicted Zn-dependent peptidase